MKNLQIIIGAVLLHIVTAADFYKQCLYLSDFTLGNVNDAAKSLNNDVQLVNIDSSWRVSAVTTCTDENSQLTGVSFTMEPVIDEDGQTSELPLLGSEGAECKTLSLSAPINRIEASTTTLEDGTTFVNSIRYVVNPNQKTYGDFSSASSAEWTFTESNPLIGLYGQVLNN